MIYNYKVKERTNKYWINARWTLGFSRKVFFVFCVGPDRRYLSYDFEKERRKHSSLAQALVYSGIFFWALIAISVVTFISLYILKSVMGIDLVPGSSPFPHFLKMIGLCHAICH